MSSTTNLTEEEQISELKDFFRLFDKADDGFILSSQLGALLKTMGQNPTEGNLKEMISRFDTKNEEGKNIIKFAEFLTLVAEMQKCHGGGSEEEKLTVAFRKYDKDNTGRVLISDLPKIFDEEFGEKLSDEEIQEIVKEVSGGTTDTEDGKVNYTEIVKVSMSK